MSTKYLRELLESVDVLNPERACEGISEALQELRQVEADRAKDAELIQMLVDGLHKVATLADVDTDDRSTIARDPLYAAEAAGFKPSGQCEVLPRKMLRTQKATRPVRVITKAIVAAKAAGLKPSDQ